MKNVFIRLLLLILAFVTVFSLVACNNDTPPDNTDDGGDNGGNEQPGGDNGGEEDDGTGIDWESTGLEGLALIYEGKARFQVVYTAASGSAGLRKANSFVKRLRELGIDVADAVVDTAAEAVKSCEIIFGSDAKNRTDEVSVSEKYLGKDGRTIKVVGTRVIIAGGNASQLDKAVSRFTTNIMGIKSSTKKLEQFAIASDFLEEALTSYEITSVKIAGVDLGEFSIVEDFSEYTGGGSYFRDIKDFRDELYDDTGIWLEYASENTDGHKIIFRYTKDMDERGFAAYVSGGNLIVECSYANAFDKAYREVMNKYLFDLVGDVKIPEAFNYVKDVSVVCYSEFGADATGKTDTYRAIYDTHIYANECGQRVIGTEGAIYRIDDIPTPVPVKTDVDFCGATFRVNDVGDEAYKHRENALFLTERDKPEVIYRAAEVSEMSSERTLTYGDTSIPWLAPYLTEKSFVIIFNTAHRDYVRFGANQNSGNQRRDLFIIDADGTIDPETEVCFHFDNIDRIEVYSATDAPITIKNGSFVNICCKAVAATDFANKYRSFKRGFQFMRSNVTVENIQHTLEGEPELDLSYDSRFGKRNESYPYGGFFSVDYCYNLVVKNSLIVGHTVYYEDKPATESTGGVTPNPVPMGTYDLTISNSTNISFYNVDQIAPPTGIGDSRYWGIMGSNFAKNLLFDGCSLSRIDAHCGFWDCDIINTEIGHTINIIGGGTLYLKNVSKLVGTSFISIRGDYGGTFRGDIIVEDCTIYAANDYNSWNSQYNPTPAKNAYVINSGYSKDGANGYWDWDFGYDCYLGKNVVIDNLKSYAENTYVFTTFADEVFINAKRFHITESVTLKNMKRIAICPDPEVALMNAIPLILENIKSGDDGDVN